MLQLPAWLQPAPNAAALIRIVFEEAGSPLSSPLGSVGNAVRGCSAAKVSCVGGKLWYARAGKRRSSVSQGAEKMGGGRVTGRKKRIPPPLPAEWRWSGRNLQ